MKVAVLLLLAMAVACGKAADSAPPPLPPPPPPAPSAPPPFFCHADTDCGVRQICVLPAGTCSNVLRGPIGVRAVRNGSEAVVTWEAVPDATGYEVGRTNRTGGKPELVASTATDTLLRDPAPPSTDGIWYAVRAKLPAGPTLWTYGRLDPVFPPPADVQTKSLIQGIRVSWFNSNSQNLYTVLRADTAAGPFTEIATVPGGFATTEFYDDLRLGVSDERFYEVVATFFGVQGITSAPVRGVTQGPPPPPPTNVTATLIDDGFLPRISWTASPGALRYRVSKNGEILDTVTGTSYVAAFFRLSTDATVSFDVVAENDGGESFPAPSNLVTTAPGALYGAVTATGAMSEATLVWTDRPRAYPLVYRVLRSPAAAGPFVEVGATPDLGFTDATTGDWTTVCYQIVVDFGTGRTGPSNVSCTETRGPPDQLNAGSPPLGIVQQDGHTVHGQTFAVAQTGRLVGLEISPSQVIDPIRIVLRFFDGDAFLTEVNEGSFLNQPLTTPPAPLDRATNGTFFVDLTSFTNEKIFVAAGGSLRFDVPQIFQPSFQLQLGTTSGDAYPAGARTVDGVPVADGTDLVFKTVVRPVAESLTAPVAFPAAPGPDRVQLAWKGVAGAASYHLQRSADGGATFADLPRTPETAWLDTGLPSGARLSYRIAPVGGSGIEGPATTVVATTRGTPDAQRTNTGFVYTGPATQPFTAGATGLLTGILLQTTGSALQVSVTDSKNVVHGPVSLFPALPPEDPSRPFDMFLQYVDVGSLGVEVAAGDLLSFTVTALPAVRSPGIAAGADPGGGFTLGAGFVPDQAIWHQTFVAR